MKKHKKIGIKAILFKLFARLFPKDSYVLGLCDRIGAYRYLQKYRYVLENFSTSHIYTEKKSSKSFTSRTIWLFWLQGFDKAPAFVQKCRDSIIKHNPDMEVNVIDQSNLEQYIQLPEYINYKHDIGIIPHSHYADVIRIALLAKYGGTWIDATVLATGALPKHIVNSELFCYKVSPIAKVVASNWFISAAPNNPIILQMKSLLYEYWKKEERLITYSFFHLFWTMTVCFNETNRAIWENVPYFDDVNCKILEMEWFKPFSQERFEQIKSISPIHKLTYKFDKENTNKVGTFYQHIIREL
jgi:hypothetical protein